MGVGLLGDDEDGEGAADGGWLLLEDLLGDGLPGGGVRGGEARGDWGPGDGGELELEPRTESSLLPATASASM